MSPLRVALCGNPNVGKSTVFNALTGLKQHTGNWAGKTVESARGEAQDEAGPWEITDLPGAYSLLNGSPEEMVASAYLAFEPLDAVIVLADACRLERSLNVALQTALLYPNTVLCLNMMDEAAYKGIAVDTALLEEQLGVPVVGISARKKTGLAMLKRRVRECATGSRKGQADMPWALFPAETRPALESWLRETERLCPSLYGTGGARLAALGALMYGQAFQDGLLARCEDREGLTQHLKTVRRALAELGYSRERLLSAMLGQSYTMCEAYCGAAVQGLQRERRQLHPVDRLLGSPLTGVPLMLSLLALTLLITLKLSNVPSEWLSHFFGVLEAPLAQLLSWLRLPLWMQDLLLNGVYRVTAWVIAVMLPPMAIFFPLFTLLEDAGLLPRIAFHLDRCFESCGACGRQALCMCMGLGCNAVGVTGCRIIQSPRERMIAILTNALVPCNGRFPTLILLIGLLIHMGLGRESALLSAFCLVLALAVSVAVTLLCSRLLSLTVLSGLPSSFTLELPPLRKPNVWDVAVRSLMERTAFVLGRAVSVAAPAGAAVWLLSHAQLSGTTLLQFAASALEPVGCALGMDGAILLAFILGFPANEIVLPMLLMIYQRQQTLMGVMGMNALSALLASHGWTLRTALCMAVLTLFHFPCSTTLLTIRRETGSLRWTALAMLLPTAVGCALCAVISLLTGLL